MTCPACRVANAADRVLCGRCGQDLLEPAAPEAVAPAGDVGGRRRRRLPVAWILPVLAVAATVLVVGAVLALLEVGPFAVEEELPEAAFQPAVYADEPVVLALSDVATLTERDADDERSFAATNLVDNTTFTSWIGDADALPSSTNEMVDLFLAEPAWITAIVLANGDHLDASAYEESGRVQRAAILVDGDLRIPVTLLDQGLEPQILELEEPVLTTAVRLEILETVPGSTTDDPAISRLEVRGHPATADDAEVADERQQRRPAAGVIAVAPS